MTKTHPEAHPINDEYHWPAYTKEYAAQVKGIEEAPHLLRSFTVKKSRLTENGLEFDDNFHPNWMQIYNSVYKCAPKSVFECGCGGLYHLKNIKIFFPDIKVAGCDLLQSQIDFGAKKFSVSDEILSNVSVRDFTSSTATDGLPKFEFVFSHAVMMHLSQKRALKFMQNMVKLSSKYIFFIEGSQHDYLALLQTLGVRNKFDVENPKDFKDMGTATLLTLK